MNAPAPALLHDPLPEARRVAVLGLGASGLAAARLLALFDKEIVASDMRTDLDYEALAAKLPARASLVLGSHPLDGVDAVVLSPGIPPSAAVVKRAVELGLPVIAEFELGYRATATPFVAITGTDGKTTTTMLTAAILHAQGLAVGIGGNIGTPVCDVLADAHRDASALEVFVVEVSAFQLAHCPTFAPRVLIATNIAEDHVEYFRGDWEAYVAAKRRPLTNMGPDDVAVLNADDRHVRTWGEGAAARVVWYGASDEGHAGYSSHAAIRVTTSAGTLRVDHSALPFRGKHNHYNALAAALGAQAAGASLEAIERGLLTFQVPPHRIEMIRSLENIAYINDSKATNPHAAMAGLATVDGPVVLIAGGVDKGLGLSAWAAAICARCNAVVLIGELAPRLRRALEEQLTAGPDAAAVQLVEAESMADAVTQARALAHTTGAATVLLSPGCSSFDMFESYGQRGNVFRADVQALTQT